MKSFHSLKNSSFSFKLIYKIDLNKSFQQKRTLTINLRKGILWVWAARLVSVSIKIESIWDILKDNIGIWTNITENNC